MNSVISLGASIAAGIVFSCVDAGAAEVSSAPPVVAIVDTTVV